MSPKPLEERHMRLRGSYFAAAGLAAMVMFGCGGGEAPYFKLPAPGATRTEAWDATYAVLSEYFDLVSADPQTGRMDTNWGLKKPIPGGLTLEDVAHTVINATDVLASVRRRASAMIVEVDGVEVIEVRVEKQRLETTVSETQPERPESSDLNDMTYFAQIGTDKPATSSVWLAAGSDDNAARGLLALISKRLKSGKPTPPAGAEK